MSGPRPLVLSGPSGAGKSTLMKRLMKEHEGIFGFSVSHTTRNPRPGEEDGKGLNKLPMLLGATLLPVAAVFSSEDLEMSSSFSCPNESETTEKVMSLLNHFGDITVADSGNMFPLVMMYGLYYHFTTRDAMEEGISRGDFIENAEFSGNMYGTSKAAVEDVLAQNLICILDVDIQGVKRIKETDLNPIYISIQPPSMEILEKRLRDRQTETEGSLQKRLEAARIDMELSKEPGVFDVVIINDDLERAYEELKDVLNDEIKKVQDAK